MTEKTMQGHDVLDLSRPANTTTPKNTAPEPHAEAVSSQPAPPAAEPSVPEVEEQGEGAVHGADLPDGADDAWFAVGSYALVEVNPDDITEVELQVIVEDEDQSGTVFMDLSPSGVRDLYEQLAEIVDAQNHAQWVAAGAEPAENPDVDPGSTSVVEDDGAEDDDGAKTGEGLSGRARRVFDPGGFGRTLEKMNEYSEDKGLDLRIVIFFGFIILIAVSMILSAVF